MGSPGSSGRRRHPVHDHPGLSQFIRRYLHLVRRPQVDHPVPDAGSLQFAGQPVDLGPRMRSQQGRQYVILGQVGSVRSGTNGGAAPRRAPWPPGRTSGRRRRRRIPNWARLHCGRRNPIRPVGLTSRARPHSASWGVRPPRWCRPVSGVDPRLVGEAVEEAVRDIPQE